MDLSFLKNVEVKKVEKKPKGTRATLEKFPVEGANFRVYKNGRIFTDPKTAQKYNLHYGPKIESDSPDGKETIAGNGLDVFSSENWQMIATEQTVLFVAIVPREGNSKLDIYASTSYDEDGNATRSIDNNSITSYVKDTLIELLESVYGVSFEDKDYVDLSIAEEFAIEAPADKNGDRAYSIPKIVSKGEKKGQQTFVTRTNIDVFPLVVFEGAPTDPNQVDLEDSIAEVEKETVETTDPVDAVEEKVEYEEPSIHNNFATDVVKEQ